MSAMIVNLWEVCGTTQGIIWGWNWVKTFGTSLVQFISGNFYLPKPISFHYFVLLIWEGKCYNRFNCMQDLSCMMWDGCLVTLFLLQIWVIATKEVINSGRLENILTSSFSCYCMYRGWEILEYCWHAIALIHRQVTTFNPSLALQFWLGHVDIAKFLLPAVNC